MHEARLRPDDLGEMRQEGDDVVLDLALDLVDPLDVERGFRPFSQTFAAAFGNDAEIGQGVVACASISNQMRYLVSGDQIATISGRL